MICCRFVCSIPFCVSLFDSTSELCLVFSSVSGHGFDVKCAQWHPEKSLLASGSKDSTVKLWDPKSPRYVRFDSPRDHRLASRCILLYISISVYLSLWPSSHQPLSPPISSPTHPLPHSQLPRHTAGPQEHRLAAAVACARQRLHQRVTRSDHQGVGHSVHARDAGTL